MALTPKQDRFAQEYIIDLNAKQAAIRAGYSEKTAEQIGYQLLQNTSVQKVIQKAIADRQKRTGVTQDMVVEELRAVAFSKAADYTDSTLKYSNKLKALELLGRHLGMFTDKMESKNDTTMRFELAPELGDIAE